MTVRSAPHALPSTSRNCWRDPRTRWGSPQAGQKFKGFHTQDADARLRSYKAPAPLMRSEKYYPKLVSGWRLSSSWRGPPECAPKSGRWNSRKEAADWYSRWERHRRAQYAAFVAHVEEDPYQALFGASNRWLGWLKSSSGPLASNTSKQTTQPLSPTPKPQKPSSTPLGSKSDKATFTEEPKLKSSSTASIVHEQLDYEIDPITLRKVPRRSVLARPTPTPSSQLQSKNFELPVKTYQAASNQDDTSRLSSALDHLPKDKLTPQVTSDWLSQEEFGQRKANFERTAKQMPLPPVTFDRTAKIESALDRHVSSTSSRIPALSSMEPEKDDMNILRASDVRASSGLRGRTPKESTAEKDVRQKTLEKSYETLPRELGSDIAFQEVSNMHTVHKPGDAGRGKDQSISTPTSEDGLSEEKRPIVPQTSTATTQLESKTTSDQIAKIRAKLVPLKAKLDSLQEDYGTWRKRLLLEKRRIEDGRKKKVARETQRLLEHEIERQKAGMQAMELRRAKGPDSRENAPGKRSLSHSELRGEGDLASNVHEFAGSKRWYKRKAPHAQCGTDAKLYRLATEKAFVREIRNIYEHSYGTICTSHRQSSVPLSEAESKKKSELSAPTTTCGKEFREIASELDLELDELRKLTHRIRYSTSGDGLLDVFRQAVTKLLHKSHEQEHAQVSKCTPSPTELSAQPETSVYRILAYDSSAQKVTSAKTESQRPLTKEGSAEEQPLTSLQALNKLQNPGKFLPHLMSLQNKGYEVVSGASDILIMKKVRDPILPKEDHQSRPNPVDGTTTPEVSTGNFASPTGYVNYGPVIPPEEQGRERTYTTRPTDKVRRQEDVFSGASSSDRHDGRRTRRDKRRAKRRQTFKRMLLTGAVTAAACYTTGMLFEMMHM